MTSKLVSVFESVKRLLTGQSGDPLLDMDEATEKLQSKIQVSSSLRGEEKKMLKEAFDKIKDEEGLVTKFIFRMEVLGAQVPDVIAERIFSIFASVLSSKGKKLGNIQRRQDMVNTIGNTSAVATLSPDRMDFDDICDCYRVFKHRKRGDFGQLCFEMSKLTKDQASLTRDDLVHLCVRILQMDANLVNLFYKRSQLDPRISIQRDEFLEVFPLVETIPFFDRIPGFVTGFKKENLNMAKSLYQNQAIGLSAIVMDQTRRQASIDFEMADGQLARIRHFYDEEILGQSSTQAINVFKKLLGEISNKEIYHFLLSKVTQFKANDFEFFQRLIAIAIKPTSPKQKLEFMFDLFSDFEERMLDDQVDRFCQLFECTSRPAAVPIDKDDFTEHYLGAQIDNLDVLQDSKNMMIGMLGIQSDATVSEQHDAVLALLGQAGGKHINLDDYLEARLHEEEHFFVIEKGFWDKWTASTDVSALKDQIDNLKLMHEGHQLRQREDMEYGRDFVLVPKYVFKSLSNWYGCNKTIELPVVSSALDTKGQEHGASHGKHTTGFFSPSKRPMSSQIGASVEVNEVVNDNEQHGGEATEPLKTTMLQTLRAEGDKGTITKVVDSKMYQLDTRPKIIYFARVPQDGELIHQQNLKNDVIDKEFMNKHFKAGKQIPFQELYINNTMTGEVLLKSLSEKHNKAAKKARLQTKEQVLSGTPLKGPLAELGVEHGSVIYIEFLEVNNTWPTDNRKARMSKQKDDPAGQAGEDGEGAEAREGQTVGLYNIGNTCYMNSALQCIANIRLIHQYFVKTNLLAEQLNTNNEPTGYKGEVAKAFAQIAGQLWTTQQVVVPKGFRHTIAKLNEQFAGDQQQDAQEYINFLLDGLHEDTNLRKIRPYIANPDSDNKEIIELSLEQWSNALRRDWSFIFFLFYGQLKSTLECQACQKQSTTFDIFTSVPLSLPEPATVLLNIVVHRLPTNLKNVIKKLDTYQPPHRQGQDGGTDDWLLEDNYNNLANDQPIHIRMLVDKNILIADLVTKITEFPEVNIDTRWVNEQMCSQLILFSTNLGTVRGVFDPRNRLTQYKLITDEIHAREVLSPSGKEDVIRSLESGNTALHADTLPYLFKHLQKDSRSEEHRKASEADRARRKKKLETFGKAYIFNNQVAAANKFETLRDLQRLPEQIIFVAYHRRFVEKQGFFASHQPQFISSPIVSLLPLCPTGRRIYEEVWSLAQVILKKNSAYLPPQSGRQQIWWDSEAGQEAALHPEKGGREGQYKPFVLKYVDRQGYSCSKCNWLEKCSGCIIEPTDAPIPDFLRYCHIAIEWHSQMIEENYNPIANEIMRHVSVDQTQQDEEEQVISLEKCLENFHATEQLSEKINCTHCKEPTVQSKTLEVFRPPPVLIVQLKRFKQVGTQRRKMQATVEYPINNLDLSDLIGNEDFMKQLRIGCVYDLYGIINHYGSLTYGHYVSIVRNPYENKWYKYDDHMRVEIQESQITKENAYILFYVRRDISTKDVEDVLPKQNDFFPGRPVTIRGNRDGFILGAKRPARPGLKPNVYFVKVKDPGDDVAVHEVKITDILMDNGEFCDEERQVERKMSFGQRLSMRAAQLSSRFSLRLLPESLSGARKQVQVGDARTEKANLLAGNEASYDSRPIDPGRTGDQEEREDSLNVSMEEEPAFPEKKERPLEKVRSSSGLAAANPAVPEHEESAFRTGNPRGTGSQQEALPPFNEPDADHPSNSSQQPLIRADLSEQPSEGSQPARKKKKKKKKKPELEQQLDDVAEEPGPDEGPNDGPIRLPPPNHIAEQQ